MGKGVLMMEKKFKIAGSTLLAVVVLSASVWVGSAMGADSKVQAVDSAAKIQGKNLISVTGQGEIKVDPDVAYISLGIETQAKTANDSQAANAKAFTALEKVLLETYKIDEKEIKTTGFHVNPQYNYQDNKEPEITGYTTMNMIEVTYRDLDNIGSLLDAASKAGANRINQIRFDSEKIDEYELQALEKAMANAKVKAEGIADSLNKSLKAAVYVEENGYSGGGFYDNSVRMEKAAMDTAGGSSTSISGGQLTISTNVSVQYEF
jgi:uncharacterized protein YggE